MSCGGMRKGWPLQALLGLVVAVCVYGDAGLEQCRALPSVQKCQNESECAQLWKCATDICAVPGGDVPFDRMNMTCHLMCSCGLYDHTFIPTFIEYCMCLTKTHNLPNTFLGFDDSPKPYQCPAVQAKDVVPVGLDAWEGVWYLTQGTSGIENLTCTQMNVTRLNETHYIGSEYQEGQVARLGMRWSQVAYLLSYLSPGVFDMRMLLPTLSNASVCHCGFNVRAYSPKRWLIFEYCSVPYTGPINPPTFGWWSFTLYSATPQPPQDALDKWQELLAANTPTDTRTNQTVPIKTYLTTHNDQCRYRHNSPADQGYTSCQELDIMGSSSNTTQRHTRSLRGFSAREYAALSPYVVW